MEQAEVVRAYYRAVDDGEYDRLRGLLTPEFVHVRPDRTLSGRDRFVQFMRDERPDPDTSHEIGTLYAGASGVAVRGVLRRGDGSVWFEFVDTFEMDDGTVTRLTTYVDR